MKGHLIWSALTSISNLLRSVFWVVRVNQIKTLEALKSGSHKVSPEALLVLGGARKIRALCMLYLKLLETE